jgi:acyl-CoA thioesterase I
VLNERDSRQALAGTMLLGTALALASCDGEAPAPAAEASQAQQVSATAASAPRPPAGPQRLILAFGDSLYAGYNLSRDQAYPAQLERALWQRGVNAEVVNAGVSGDTTAAGRQRLDFTLSNLPRSPDLAIVGLGGNDMLRGLPPAQARANLDAILAELDERGIPVVLTGMLAAPNLWPDYALPFNAIYPDLAAKYDAALVPFFLQPVLGRPQLMQADRIHPTAAGIEAIVAATVDQVAQALPEPVA